MSLEIISARLPWQIFLREQQLPDNYRATAERWFLPLAQAITERYDRQPGPLLLGINGCQGSGKSTLAAFLKMALPELRGLSVCVLSIDDFYLSRDERVALANSAHPLLATRGVPGTHDIANLKKVISQLVARQVPIDIPRFNKATDDCGESERLSSAVDVIILEGWCVGVGSAPGFESAKPINALEANQDADGSWRDFIDTAIKRHYVPLYQQIQMWVMLAAPSFACVHRWRGEQEAKLRARHGDAAEGIMTDEEIARFVQYYQRLTERALVTLPAQVDFCYQLESNRQICALLREIKEISQ